MRPQQAVILAGGRGTRLKPLSDIRPKPMVEVHGKPFLEHLLLELKRAGFERVLLLVGYMADTIRDHFGDGEKLGLSIRYHHSPEEFETGARVFAARDMIESLSMLLYADNLWPIPIDAMCAHFAAAKTLAMLAVYRSPDGYSRSNCATDGLLLTCYDKSRTGPNLTGVDIGFMFLRKEVLDLLPATNCSFEATIYPQLVAKRQLAAFQTGHRYYSMTGPNRLPLVEAYLSDRRTVLLDRDGTINHRAPQGEYIGRYEEFRWLPGALDAMRLLRENNCRVIIISNQAGIARGLLTDDGVQSLHRQMVRDIGAHGGHVDAIYYCPHHWDDGCACRKPNPGMLFAAQRDFSLNLSRTPFIGDDERDGQAAEAADAPFLRVTEERPLLTVVKEWLASAADEGDPRGVMGNDTDTGTGWRKRA